MHRYAAKKAMDGVCCYAPGERSEVCCDSGGDDCGRREADMTSLLGQAIRSAADMQGRAKWAWLEDRRESSQLCAGQEMVRVGHEVMRVRRPSFKRYTGCAPAIHALCGEDEEEGTCTLLLPTEDAEAGSTLTRGKPHIALAHNVYLYYYCWPLLSSHMHRAISRVRAIGLQAQHINQYRQQQVRMKHHLMIGTWYVLS